MGSLGGPVNATPDLIARSLEAAVSYDDYFARMAATAEGGEMYDDEKQNFYARLNHQRMKRLNGTVELADDVVEAASRIDCDIRLLAISEGWCGDAAQVLPVLNLLERRFDTLEHGIVHRDEHPDLMEAFLTDGSRSIPKVIMIERNTLEVRGDWGPRPRPAQDLFEIYRSSDPKLDYGTFQKELQKWYLRDRAEHIQRELVDMLDGCRS
jgi:hypothetical protein